MIGVAALVPPTPSGNQPPLSKLSKTATPVLGLATAATSFSVRFRQPPGEKSSARCHDGLATSAEQPLAVPSECGGELEPQTVSVQPLPWLVRRSVVPPMAVTYCRSVGYAAP